jgi:hypothetical protein
MILCLASSLIFFQLSTISHSIAIKKDRSPPITQAGFHPPPIHPKKRPAISTIRRKRSRILRTSRYKCTGFTSSHGITINPSLASERPRRHRNKASCQPVRTLPATAIESDSYDAAISRGRNGHIRMPYMVRILTDISAYLNQTISPRFSACGKKSTNAITTCSSLSSRCSMGYHIICLDEPLNSPDEYICDGCKRYALPS